MNSNQELYQFINELQNELEKLQEFSYRERLHSALHISSVVTEVFMALRKELTDLLSSNINLTPEFRNKITKAIQDIGQALR